MQPPDEHHILLGPDSRQGDGALDAFFQMLLGIVARDKARSRPLPRSTKFANTFQENVVDSKGRVAAKTRTIGTALTPDEDVLAMDATIPRAPELLQEE